MAVHDVQSESSKKNTKTHFLPNTGMKRYIYSTVGALVIAGLSGKSHVHITNLKSEL